MENERVAQKSSDLRDRIFGALSQAQIASQGTKQLEKSKEIVTHRKQLEAVLKNWADPRNMRAAHSVLNLVQAMNKASGVNFDNEHLRAAIPEEAWDRLLNLYMAWQEETVKIVEQYVVDPTDVIKGAAVPEKKTSRLDELGVELAKAVQMKDKDLQQKLMKEIANLGDEPDGTN